MLRILFLFNAVPDQALQGPYSDCLSWKTVRLIYRALLETGNKIYPLNLHSRRQLDKALARMPTLDLAFVVAEGFLEEPCSLYDGSGAATVRMLLQEYGFAASHSTAATMNVCRHKNLTYEVLAKNGLPVTRHILLDPSREDTESQLAQAIAMIGFPLFVKPNGGGNSIGIDAESLVYDHYQLERKILQLRQTLGDLPILVEEYLPGQEFTVAALGQAPPYVLPPLAFISRKIRSTVIKRETTEFPTCIFADDERYPYLSYIARQVFFHLGARTALRIDIRANAAGKLCIIDVNGTPSLNPASSLMTMASSLGLNYNQMIYFVLHQSLLDYNILPNCQLQKLVAPVLDLLSPYQLPDKKDANTLITA
ncbi:MAG: hypothetical protein GX039_05540 [Clostridia bacterium]|nr:hypothetical protein [Clostridia bacterium]